MRKARDSRPLDGILLLDKPAGIGSNAALQYSKRLYRAERAGHTGTLDPMASGLLAVCFGEATKFAGELLDATKSYKAQLTLGVRTATGDAEGEVIVQRQAMPARAEVEAALSRFRGEICQVPPMHSALKRAGRPLYSYARRGESVPREPRRVTIHSLEFCSLTGPLLELCVTCSKGTYVRVFAEDLGEALGCGAHLSGLVRTRVGPFDLGRAHTLDRLSMMSDADRDRLLLPVDGMLKSYPEIELGSADEVRFCRGQAVASGQCIKGIVRVYGARRAFLGVGLAQTTGSIRPKRLLNRAGTPK